MVNWLSTDAVAQQKLPYSWTLSGSLWEGDANSTAPWGAESDGYQVVAALGWVKLSEENADASGTSGACVEARDSDGGAIQEGYPVVCTMIDTDGDIASVGSVTILDNKLWDNGKAAEFKSSNRGQSVEASVNTDAMKLVEAAVDEADDAEPEDDSFEDNDLQADDDGWADTASDAIDDATDAVDEAEDSGRDALDGAVDDANSAVDNAKGEADAVIEKVKAYVHSGPSVTFQWYQPAMAKSYAGLRRYGAGDKVQAYTVAQNDDADTPLVLSPTANVVTLTGATTLIAGVMAFGAATLSL